MDLLAPRRRHLAFALVFTSWGLGGCGTQGDARPLPDRWPLTPLRGFALLNPESPLLLSRPGWDAEQPAVEPAPVGTSALVVWGRMAPRGEPARGVLFRGTLEKLDEEGTFEAALEPSLAWEGRGLANPSWLAPTEGAADTAPLLFYQGEDGSVGVASRRPDGTLEKKTLDRPLVTPAALGAAPGQLGRVTPVGTGAGLRLYYVLDGQVVRFAETELAQLRRRLADPAAEVVFRLSGPVLGAADCTVNPGKRGAAAAERLEGLSVRRVITPAGRPRFDLYAQAIGGGKAALIAASSYSGGGPMDPFLPVEAPLLMGLIGAASAPSVFERDAKALMVLGLREVQLGVALAEQQPPSSPSTEEPKPPEPTP